MAVTHDKMVGHALWRRGGTARFRGGRAGAWRAVRAGTSVLLLASLLAACAAPGEQEAAPGADGRLQQLQGDRPSSLAAALSPVGSAQEALDLGDKAAARGDLDEAILRYVRAAELRPEDPGTIHKIGHMHDQLGNFALAALGYRMALEADQGYAPAHESLGLLLMRARRLEEAKEHLQRAVALDRSRWRSHNGLGILSDLDGRFDDAVGHYRSAVALQPASAMVVTNLGYSYYLQGRYGEARKSFEQAIALEPRYTIARRNLAIIHVREREFEKALRLLEADSSTAAAYNDLGYLSTLAGEYAAARTFLNRAIELSPTYYARAHENLANLERHEARKADTAGASDSSGAVYSAEALAASSTPPAAATRTLALLADDTSAPGQAMQARETPAQPGPLLQERLRRTQEWLGGVSVDFYTVQLMTADGDAEEALEYFLLGQGERGLLEDTYVYRRPGTGAKRYYVLYHSFSALEDARKAVQELPESLQAMEPYVRRISQFHVQG